MGANAQRRRAAKDAARRETPEQRRSRLTGQAYSDGYRAGYIEAYTQAITDLTAGTTVTHTAANIIAVHHDPEEQARYVLTKAQEALRPKDLEGFANGLNRAFATHLHNLGASLPGLPGGD